MGLATSALLLHAGRRPWAGAGVGGRFRRIARISRIFIDQLLRTSRAASRSAASPHHTAGRWPAAAESIDRTAAASTTIGDVLASAAAARPDRAIMVLWCSER